MTPARSDAGDVMLTVSRRETGYAMLTAVVAMALLAMMSLSLVSTAAGITAGVAADAEQARLSAAADAVLVVAVGHLADPDRTRRWSIDGRSRPLSFAGTDLIVAVEDERGKIPLNQITDEQARALFEAFGASGEALAVQTDAFLDWRDDDDEARADGAEAEFYAPRGIRPRNGALRSLGELGQVRGLPPGFAARLRGLVTVHSDDSQGFDDRFAPPLALTVMNGGGIDGPAAIQRERELAGQRPAIELAPAESLVGRPLTIHVTARRPGGGFLERRTLIALTGRAATPFVVRARG